MPRPNKASTMIPIAAIYIFLIVALFFYPPVFWMSMAVLLLVYLIKPELLNCAGQLVFTNLTYTVLAIVVILLVIGIIVFATKKAQICHMSKHFFGLPA